MDRGHPTQDLSGVRVEPVDLSLRLEVCALPERLDLVGEGRQDALSALELDLPASVGGYTEIVDALILLVHDELSLLTRAKVSTEMQGLIALMRAKEAAGLERAQGNAAFSSSSMPQQRHQTVISLISLQDEMFDEFASIMPDDWKARLNGLLKR